MKKVLVIVAVILVVAGAVAAWYFFGGNDVAMARRAMAGNGAVTCTFVDPESDEEGKFYVRDGEMRTSMVSPAVTTEIFSETNNEDVLTHMLLKGDTSYIWSEGEAEGFMFKNGEDGQEAERTPLSNYEDEEKFKREYEENQLSCDRGADEELFKLPSDVEFVDFNELLNDQFEGMETEAQPVPEEDGEEQFEFNAENAN